MRHRDWRRLALISFVVGLVFLVSGLVTWLYKETVKVAWISFETYPYRDYTVPLLILAIVAIVVGFLSFTFAAEERIREARAEKPTVT